MGRPGGVVLQKKGENSGNLSVAMATSSKVVPTGAPTQDVGVTHGDILIGGNKHGTGTTDPILLPEKSVQAAEISVVPEQSEIQPVDAGLKHLPDVGVGYEGTRSLNKMKKKMGPELRSSASDRIVPQDVRHGSVVTLEESSVQIREQITVGGKEKENVVVPQSRQAAVRENRKLTEKGLNFALVTKGKTKGKSLQPSK